MSTTTQRLAQLSPLQLALAAQQLEAKRPIMAAEPLAIVGLGCRFPGANSPAEFWQLLHEGRTAHMEVPPDRWDIDALYDPDPKAPGKMYTRRAAFLDRIDAFDPQFFGISPREARSMDPQQRLLLEVAWEALESANLSPARFTRVPTGVYIGMCTYDYMGLVRDRTDPAAIDLYYSTGGAPSVAAGRVSYTLGLTGPCMTIDTACSSALVAIHQAAMGLRARECDIALAGGVSLMIAPDLSLAFCRAGMLSRDGHCRTFDRAADGYGRGEGCGMIVLKRLADAVADEDDVIAVLRGSAVNQDGPSGGLTVPSGPAQQTVMRRALESAGVQASQVNYIEVHGTATKLGDPVEVNAIGAVFGGGRVRESHPLFLGAVKTNIGHLEAAAGVASVLKVALSLRHGVIPAHLNFTHPSPLIDWEHVPCVVPTKNTPWPDGRRIAGINSFGYSGTNAHVILESAPAAEPVSAPVERPRHLLTLSAKSTEALADIVKLYSARLGRADASLADICHTAAVGRAHFHHRLAIHASTAAELREQLERVAIDQQRAAAQQEPGVAFLFTGEPLAADAGRELYETRPQFRDIVDRSNATTPDARSVAVQCALATLWRDWGIEPIAVWGSGAGELAARVFSGSMSLEDALRAPLPAPRTLDESRLRNEGCSVFLEIALRGGDSDWAQLLEKVAVLYTRGVNLDWDAFDRGYARRRVSLPSYPFQRQSYWLAESVKQRRVAVPDIDPAAHPLLGARLHSAALEKGEIVFESRLSAKSPRYLGDHRVFESAVLPAAAFVEIALAAGTTVFGTSGLLLENIVLSQALLLPEDEEKIVQTVLRGNEFKIFSRSHDSEWTLHANGTVRPANGSISAKRRNGVPMTDVDVAALYDAFGQLGLHYGPAFRAATEVRRNGNTTAGRVVLPPAAGEDASYCLHPSLLDGAFHAFGPLFEGHTDTYLPTGFERVRFHRRPSGTLQCHASIEGDGRVLSGNLELFDDTGVAIAEFEGMTIQRVAREAVMRSSAEAPSDWFYDVAWREKPATSGALTVSRTWLITGSGTTPTELAAILERAGDRATVTEPAGVRSLLQAAAPSFDGCIYVASDDTFDSCADALDLVKAIVDAGGGALWVVTEGAQQVGADPEPLHVQQAALWGLARVVASEGIGLKAIRIDVDPAADARTRAACIAGELSGSDNEDQIAYRKGVRHVARLVRRPAALRNNGPVRLQMAQGGTFENLRIVPLQRRTPGAGEIEIEVRASGLNFRDLLYALGMLPAPGDEIVFGFECAGIVTAAGADVTQFRIGQEVMALGRGTIGSFATVFAAHTIPKPAALTFEEAAALPLVYLTAIHGLEKLAQIRPGDRVLIHAASGGVGQAAVQIARRAGAEVFATASRAKWPRLESQGVRHVMDSRSLDYADEILRITGGEGVDIILNSLNGDYIERNLRCLRTGGRFVELGKIGIWTDEQMRAARPDVSYFPFDLGEVALADPDRIASMLHELAQSIDDRSLAPLPVETFPLQDAASAFRYMAQSKHFGKVTVSCASRAIVRSEATYVITGGLGALGLEVARWLIREGARRLVLVSRQERSPEAVAELRASGAEIIVRAADVSDAGEVSRVIDIANTPSHPLRGVIHAAGVLDDCSVLELDRERLRRVLAPKTDGAWQLHLQTRELPLDFFVCFSSLSSLIGTPGQAAYAAANSFMDALAHHRRSQRLPMLSVNWGPWAGGGMAARMSERHRERVAQRGFLSIDPARGVQSLGELLRQNAVQAAVFPAKWDRVLEQFPSGAEPPFYSELAGELRRREVRSERKSEYAGFAAQFAQAPAGARHELAIELLRQILRTILGVEARGRIEADRPLSEVGLDSLMGIELKSRVGSELGVNLPLQKVAGATTLDGLAALLVEQLSLMSVTTAGETSVGEGIEEITL